MKVLVIDDVAMNCRLVEVAIREFCDGGILFACRGTEGIELARKERPDLIFLDLSLPDIDGLEVAKIIRSAPECSSVKLIALTARVEPDSERSARSAGCEDFLKKPVDIQILRKLVRKMKLGP